MPIPTAAVTIVVRSAVTLIACSCARGMTSTAASPANGTKTARVRAHSSNQCMASPYLVSDGVGEEQGEAEHGDPAEEQEGVPLDAPRLDATQLAARFAGLSGEFVDGPVDDTLVQVGVRVPRRDGGTPAGA